MRIALKLAFDEQAAVSLLNWLSVQNAELLRVRPELPLLYESGVVYRRERDETWSDVLNTLAQGWEDCDALAAWRVGELMARGWQALRPGDGGYREARRLQPDSIPAEAFLRTRAPHGKTGLYHVVVRYRVGSRWYRDDPSARLGMYGPERLENPWGDRPETNRGEQ